MKIIYIFCLFALSASGFAEESTSTDTSTEAVKKETSAHPKAPGTAQRRWNQGDEQQGFGRGPQPPSKKKAPGMAGLPPGSMPGSPDSNAGASPGTVKVPPPPAHK